MNAVTLSEPPLYRNRGSLLRLLFRSGQRYDLYGRIAEEFEQNGPVSLRRFGPVRQVTLVGPDANRFVLTDKEGLFTARYPWMRIMGRIFPNGLLLSDGARHRRDRRIMAGSFRTSALRDYAAQMTPMIDAGLETWQTQDSLLAFPAFKQLTLNLASAVFLGLPEVRDLGKMHRAFEDMVAASMSVIKLRIPGLEFYRGLRGRETMLAFFTDLVKERRAGDGSDLLSMLCRAVSEDEERFSDQEVIDHMIFLMMAAHDTTTSTLASLTYLLAKNPEWQERIRQQSLDLQQDFPAFDDLDRLPDLDLAIRETLRLYPPLPIIPRGALRDFDWQGYRIRRGSLVVISPVFTHRMAEWWSRPETFDPERFSPERTCPSSWASGA